MNDLIHIAMQRACEKFGNPRLFTAACFAVAINELAGLDESAPRMPDSVVAVVLCGRTDVEPMSRNGDYWIKEKCCRE